MTQETPSLEKGKSKGKWSGEVTEHEKWHPKEGFFDGSAEEIAHGLKANSKDLKQAMSRLNFYINRAGHNLSAEKLAKLNHAKEILRELYGHTTKGVGKESLDDEIPPSANW